MSMLVQKDSKNRVSIGTDTDVTYFTRELDERGRIIFTPQVVVPKDEYEEKIISLADVDRDRFITALSAQPVRNEAFNRAQDEFNKKYK
ncbi:MAG: hypothetical protein PHY93_21345 [Bacteriovorax sp.]|nr:hypothetical protein [Bacteriovorax sp.]